MMEDQLKMTHEFLKLDPVQWMEELLLESFSLTVMIVTALFKWMICTSSTGLYLRQKLQ